MQMFKIIVTTLIAFLLVLLQLPYDNTLMAVARETKFFNGNIYLLRTSMSAPKILVPVVVSCIGTVSKSFSLLGADHIREKNGALTDASNICTFV